MSWTIQQQRIGIGARATFSLPEEHEFLGVHRTRDTVVVNYRVNPYSDFNTMVTLEWCFVNGGFSIPPRDEAELLAFDPGSNGDMPMVLLRVKRP